MLTPTLFIGHGNPMYSIEKNEFSQTWEQLGKKLTIPSAIICISAHWETNGTELTAAVLPDTIHDFNGFPRKLFEVLYLPIGAPKLTHYIQNTLPKENIVLNPHRGLDHGAWSILRNMYPEANIPIIQLSIDRTKSPLEHYELGKKLSFLRKENIMIIGSGNIVHNLYKVDFDNPQNAYSWAINANNMIKTLLKKNQSEALINYKELGDDVQLAIPSPEHYIPLLYIQALRNDTDQLSFFNDKIELGSLSMTSFIFK